MKPLSYVFWVLQILLAFAYVGAGLLKLVSPMEELAAKMAWVQDTPDLLVRVIGLCEALGAVGLVLPALTRIKPFLTPLAAALLTVVMVLAALLHIFRGEYPAVLPPLVLGFLSALVAWGRWKKSPIDDRKSQS